MATTEQPEPQHVIRPHEPISRSDLLNEEFVRALWEVAEGNLAEATFILHGGQIRTEGNIFQADIGSAVHHFGISEVHRSNRSRAFTLELQRQ